MNKKEQAKQLLTHYFDIAIGEDNKLQFDSWSEINSIVDLIVDAAKEEILHEDIKHFLIYLKEKKQKN
jgi:hypothetical protein